MARYLVKWSFVGDDETMPAVHEMARLRTELSSAREALWNEVKDTLRTRRDKPELFLMVLRGNCLMAEPGDRVSVMGVDHWIEEIE